MAFIRFNKQIWENKHQSIQVLNKLKAMMRVIPSRPDDVLGWSILNNAIEHLRKEDVYTRIG